MQSVFREGPVPAALLRGDPHGLKVAAVGWR